MQDGVPDALRRRLVPVRTAEAETVGLKTSMFKGEICAATAAMGRSAKGTFGRLKLRKHAVRFNGFAK